MPTAVKHTALLRFIDLVTKGSAVDAQGALDPRGEESRLILREAVNLLDVPEIVGAIVERAYAAAFYNQKSVAAAYKTAEEVIGYIVTACGHRDEAVTLKAYAAVESEAVIENDWIRLTIKPFPAERIDGATDPIFFLAQQGSIDMMI